MATFLKVLGVSLLLVSFEGAFARGAKYKAGTCLFNMKDSSSYYKILSVDKSQYVIKSALTENNHIKWTAPWTLDFKAFEGTKDDLHEIACSEIKE